MPPTKPCAGCKFQRRRCNPECIFAPYFPAEEPRRFENVHKAFGASNVSKLLHELSPENRQEAVNSLVFEAESRLVNPAYGCVGDIYFQQQQLKHYQFRIYSATQELVSLVGPETAMRLLQDPLLLVRYHPNYAGTTYGFRQVAQQGLEDTAVQNHGMDLAVQGTRVQPQLEGSNNNGQVIGGVQQQQQQSRDLLYQSDQHQQQQYLTGGGFSAEAAGTSDAAEQMMTIPHHHHTVPLQTPGQQHGGGRDGNEIKILVRHNLSQQHVDAVKNRETEFSNSTPKVTTRTTEIRLQEAQVGAGFGGGQSLRRESNQNRYTHNNLRIRENELQLRQSDLKHKDQRQQQQQQRRGWWQQQSPQQSFHHFNQFHPQECFRFSGRFDNEVGPSTIVAAAKESAGGSSTVGVDDEGSGFGQMGYDYYYNIATAAGSYQFTDRHQHPQPQPEQQAQMMYLQQMESQQHHNIIVDD